MGIEGRYAAQLTEPEYRELAARVATAVKWGGGQ